MLSLGFIFFITMSLWNTFYGYRAIWELHKCSDEVATTRNFLDICIKFFLAEGMIGYALTEDSSLVLMYGVFAVFNQISYIITYSKYHIMALKQDLEGGK